MAHRISLAICQLIIRKQQDGYSQRQISQMLWVPRSTVNRIIVKFRNTGDDGPGHSSGRRRMTNVRDDRSLFCLCRQGCRKSAGVLRNEWGHLIGRHVSRRTTNHRLTGAGYNSRRPTIKPKLTDRHHPQRWELAAHHWHRQVQHWRHVLFSDESAFSLYKADGRMRVRRLANEALMEDCLTNREHTGGGTVHVWGAIHHGRKSALHILWENVNAATYLTVLRDVMLPYARQVFRANFIYQDE